MNKYTEEDIIKILNNYSLGKFISFEIFERHSYLQPAYILQTEYGKYFLKHYKKFNENIEKGLNLIQLLQHNNFPVINVITTTSDKTYLKYQDQYLAVFEFLNIDEDKAITPPFAYQIGKVEADLHNLAKDFYIEGNNLEYISVAYLKELIDTHKSLIQKDLEVLEFIITSVTNLNPPSNQPIGVCHKELVLEHVRFENDKLVKVIDWDLVGIDYFIFDLGTTITESFRDGEFNNEICKSIIKGYESSRKLTEWESEHIFEALIYGCFKFLIWEWSPNFVKEHGLLKTNINRVKFLMRIGKKDFQNLITTGT